MRGLTVAGRSLRVWGGRLALFAFGLQLALTFGHLHCEDVYGPLGHAVVQGHGSAQMAADRGPGSSGADTDLPGDAVEAACAICISAQFTASAALPEPIRLQIPVRSFRLHGSAGTVLALTAPAFLLHQTRAPPTALTDRRSTAPPRHSRDGAPSDSVRGAPPCIASFAPAPPLRPPR